MPQTVGLLGGHLRIVRSFKPQAVGVDSEKDLAAQRSRERNALEVLHGKESNAIAQLNLYCKKTKVDVVEEFTLSGAEFLCHLKYESILRSLEASGSSGAFTKAAEGKKQAKRKAAAALLESLRELS